LAQWIWKLKRSFNPIKNRLLLFLSHLSFDDMGVEACLMTLSHIVVVTVGSYSWEGASSCSQCLAGMLVVPTQPLPLTHHFSGSWGSLLLFSSPTFLAIQRLHLLAFVPFSTVSLIVFIPSLLHHQRTHWK
jgi:hypothetical protein